MNFMRGLADSAQGIVNTNDNSRKNWRIADFQGTAVLIKGIAVSKQVFDSHDSTIVLF